MSLAINSYQLTLDLDGGLTDRYSSVRECVAEGVYRRGLERTAADVDESPGNLSAQLSGDRGRYLSVETLERYLEKSGDRTPIYYLVARFCGDKGAGVDEALSRMPALLAELQQVLSRAGSAPAGKGRRP